ncbi:bifunctional DNA-formamidopyrimidine glycosylase/DNA-(apurinic or apyrimidinic site) lyase [candidate division KSB1 bacterium]|nr:bifunctional DNA-formamidopyrimidine glycosylase/DNA-(apurinic or apyrimidinic site) lyase [candidate division KSB1 bacterium]
MPELPEVETIRQTLEPVLHGHRLLSSHIYECRLRWTLPDHLFESLHGALLLKITRRGKYLLWHFDVGRVMLVHLGMSGRLGMATPREPLAPHTHVTWEFSDSPLIYYRDPRRFGMIDVVNKERLNEHPRLQLLGVEPLSLQFTPKTLCQVSGHRNIKTVLMDHKVVAGLGNIYVNEALFMAGIHPQRQQCHLTKAECTLLVESIKSVLTRAIEQGGTTLRDYRDARGEPGFFSLSLQVYGRENEPCLKCQTPIRRSVQSGRSTYFCPQCQNLH